MGVAQIDKDDTTGAKIFMSFATLGVLMVTPLVFAHIFVRKFRKKPGTLILWEMIAINLNFCTNIFISASILSDGVPLWGSGYVVLFLEYYTIIGVFYLLFLSIEIFMKVRYPFNLNDKKRYMFYHVFG